MIPQSSACLLASLAGLAPLERTSITLELDGEPAAEETTQLPTPEPLALDDATQAFSILPLQLLRGARAKRPPPTTTARLPHTTVLNPQGGRPPHKGDIVLEALHGEIPRVCGENEPNLVDDRDLTCRAETQGHQT